MRSSKQNAKSSASRANATAQRVGTAMPAFVDKRPLMTKQRKLQSDINMALQQKSSAYKIPTQGGLPTDIIQRTAWQKVNNKWERLEGEDYETNFPSEKTGPPNNIGEDGWIYSSNKMEFFPTVDAYKKYLDAYKEYIEADSNHKKNSDLVPAKQSEVAFEKLTSLNGSKIMTTGIEQEAKFLKGENGSMVFAEDVLNNYLLWSVPLHIGDNMIKESLKDDPTLYKLEAVSGEKAAEVAVNAKTGYMMKQTQEHFEALTAINGILADENITPDTIRSQYGEQVKNEYKTDRIDPLHYPRDPQYHSTFTEILTLIDGGIYKQADGIKDLASAEQKLASLDEKLKKCTIEIGLVGAIIEMINQSSNLHTFNEKFYKSGTAESLMGQLNKKDAIGTDRDELEQVTRVTLLDQTQTNGKNVSLIGGRQSTFNSIWGPKSTQVVEKTAQENNSIQSHGLKYHFNPSGTVQARDEFKPYKSLLEQKLALVVKDSNDNILVNNYTSVISHLTNIISKIESIQRDGEKNLTTLGSKREGVINEIEQENKAVISGMKTIRERLLELSPQK